MDKFLSIKQVQALSQEDRNKYYDMLREYAANEVDISANAHLFSKKIIAKIAPKLRNYDLDIIGLENIPREDSAVFVINHSNTHDFFTIHEVFGYLNRNVSPLGAIDRVTPSIETLYDIGDVITIDRRDKESGRIGILNIVKSLLVGKDVVVCGEATWNLHPNKPMQGIKPGASQAALMAKKVVIPTIFEYVEVPDIVDKEKNLYSKCIVEFGNPIVILPEDNLYEKSIIIQRKMEDMRRNLWKKLGIKRDTLDDINKDIYLNHTYNKKLNAFGFDYDSAYESQFLTKDSNGQIINEYTLDENGNFVPGVTPKR